METKEILTPKVQSQFDTAVELLKAKIPTTPDKVVVGAKEEKGVNFSTFSGEGMRKYIVLPKNLHEMTNSHLMQAVMGSIQILDLAPIQGTTDMSIDSLIPSKENKGIFILGFVSVCLAGITGRMNTSGSRWGKGVKCAQLTRIHQVNKNSPHLHQNKVSLPTFMDKHYKRFQKADWAVRSRICSLIMQSLNIVKITDIETYVRSKDYIVQNVIKSTFSWENGGLYTEEEIAFVKDEVSNAKIGYENFILSLEKPVSDLAINFWSIYKKTMQPLETYITFYSTKSAERAKILFPPGKAKNKSWQQTSLKDKLRSIDTDKLLDLFAPWNTFRTFSQVSITRDYILSNYKSATADNLVSIISDKGTRDRLLGSGLIPLFLSLLEENLVGKV
jgi:hypothetical protein